MTWASQPRAEPNGDDIDRAMAWIDGPYRKTVDPAWFDDHRAKLIRQAAMLEMGKRQDAEVRSVAPEIEEVGCGRG